MTHATSRPKKLGILSLTCIIVGSMIGGGAFSLPTDMAQNAGVIAILIGWIITGLGMICLALVYQNLCRRQPQLESGVYNYARAGFGQFMGFNSAWGYWLSAFLGNVAYALLLFNALSFFFPLFSGPHNIYVLVGASLIVWFVHAIALRGVQQAALINVITTIARLVPIFLLLIIMLFAFHWHNIQIQALGNPNMGSILHQVASTMMVTLWVFIGIEGAVVVSERAESKATVGKATVIGLVLTLLTYVLLNIITLAAVPREVLMQFPNPTLAYALAYVVGPWGAWLINIGLCIALFGALLSWTLLASETPYIAAKDQVMPKFFKKTNQAGAPSNALWVTNSTIQTFLIIAYLSSGTYQAIYAIAALAILPPYLLSGLYAMKIALTKDGYAAGEKTNRDLILATIASVYGFWLIYAAGINLLLVCCVLYLIGLVIFIIARQQAGLSWFANPIEIIIAIIIIAAASLGVYQIISGDLSVKPQQHTEQSVQVKHK